VLVALAAVILATPPAAAQTTPPRIAPFPRVVMSGRSFRSGTRVTRLAVRGPDGARVRVECSGRGCPFYGNALPIGDGEASFGEFPDLLAPGAVVEVSVTSPSPGTIGKHVRFRIRPGKAPARRDRCLQDDRPQLIRCPPP
jgi:hypothetical protein